ncbi:MAG: hypothetical protein ABR589_00375 [Chthoniobacterales bacterium]
MTPDVQLEKAAQNAAEEILRLVYGDDLQGCAVRIDSLTEVIRGALDEQTRSVRELSELQSKAFEAVQLLSTPPTNGYALAADDLRSLLGERLDKIRTLADQILGVTKREAVERSGEQGPLAES